MYTSQKRSHLFYRRMELEDLKRHFACKGTELTLITGPPDSGKTLLLKEVARLCEEGEHQSWFQIDMREPIHLWNSVDGVYKSLHGCFAPRIAKISKVVQESMLPSTKAVTFSLVGLQLIDKAVTLLK